MNVENRVPLGKYICNSEDFAKELFKYKIVGVERRNVPYNEYIDEGGTCDLQIFWVDKEKGLSYGVTNDIKRSTELRYYKYGSKTAWLEYTSRSTAEFSEQW